MYIQPNTTVILLTGVPLDESYDHTIKFTSAQAQQTYFMSKQLMRFDQHTYQRKERGTIRVNALADNLYHVNYLMFQNTAFGNKWFYAFVRSVNYINDQTTEIVYAIDTYQTWLFEMEVGQCFVEREHIVNDEIGASLTDEGLEVGDLEIFDTLDITGFGNSILDNFYGIVATTEYSIALSNFGASNEISGDSGYNVITGGCYYFKFQLDDMYLLKDYVRVLSEMDQLDAIVNAFLLPKVVVDSYAQTPPKPNPDTPYPMYMPDVDVLGHQPKNKKLFQYPYYFLEASDNCGNSKIYKYELFDTRRISPTNDKIAFKLSCSISPTAELILLPEYYGSSFDYNIDSVDSGFDNAMVSSSVPRIPYSSDSYAVWLAQNSTWMNGHRVEGSEYISPADVTRTVAGMGAGATGGLLAGASVGMPIAGLVAGVSAPIVSQISNVQNKMSAKEKAKLLPDKYNAGTGAVNLQYNKVGFTIYAKRVRDAMAQKIDNFFELYGYKTNELKVPNMDSRPHWNYVKTAWANISGNIPADDIVKLKEIFNNGITFWKNPSEVGNYTLNNH